MIDAALNATEGFALVLADLKTFLEAGRSAHTGGSSDHVFSLAHLLGFRFVPRLRDLADRKLGTFEGRGRYPLPAPLSAYAG